MKIIETTIKVDDVSRVEPENTIRIGNEYWRVTAVDLGSKTITLAHDYVWAYDISTGLLEKKWADPDWNAP